MAGQVALARESIDATKSMLAEQGIPSDPMAAPAPARLAGWASDGRSLRGLLQQIETDEQFDLIVRTQLQDVGRTASMVAMAVEPNVTHYVRVLSLPSCGRCVILAGKPTRSNVAFQRHPKCDCSVLASNGAHAATHVTDPETAFAQMSQGEQDKAFTKAGAEAIRMGADPARVVNARRGISTAQAFGRQLKVTTASAPRGSVRLMPESILQIADDKADAVRLLKKYGYVL